MGLPLGPTFANIFLCFNEKKWLDGCPNSFKPIFYRRYIDDTFILFRDPTHVTEFFNYIDSRHPNIRFSYTTEINSEIPFLDCAVKKSVSHFTTSVFRKDTFTGLGTSYFSFICRKFKLNSMKTLLFRGYSLSSSDHLLNIEFNFLKRFFRSNGYPNFIIERTIKSFLNNRSTRILNDPATDALYFKFPYFGYQSEKMKKDLDIILRKYIPDLKINLVLVNSFKIGSFFSYKDSLPKCVRSGLIYEYCCAQCASRYQGSTHRNFYMRIAEHAGRSFRTNSVLSQPSHSSIRLHTQSCRSDISIENFKILGYNSNLIDLRILESLYIHKTKPALNSTESSFNLAILG